jgi:hypothetical protein
VKAHAKFTRNRAARTAIAAGLILIGWGAAARAQFDITNSNVGYIDPAIPATQFRLRFDAAHDAEFADRVEFFYAKYNTPGLPQPELAIDHQELSAYLEYAAMDCFSVFAEVPVRWIDPVVNDNTGGLYDMNAGAKLAVHRDDASVLSLQFRTYMATGDTRSGLGTDHASLEPAILFFRRLSDRWTTESELRYWIPIDASTTGPGGGMGGGGGGGGGGGRGGNREFGGGVLRYGVALGYTVCDTANVSVTPITEIVGWHIFDGLKTDPATGLRVSADNDAIVNLKLGLRFGLKNSPLLVGDGTSLFVGYGTALTEETWYNDILRVELRWAF